MINLAVINLKSLIKKIIKIIIVALIATMIFKFINIFKAGNFTSKFFSKFKSSHVEIIEETVGISNYFNNNKTSKKESNLKKLLVSELSVFSTEDELMEKENQEEVTEFENNDLKEKNNTQEDKENDNKQNEINQNNIIEEQKTDIQLISVGNNNINNENIEIPYTAQTTVIETNNKVDKYTDVYHSVKIRNESKYTLTEEMLKPDIDFTNKKDIIIYHTHTCESYTQTESNQYEASGNFRTTDLNHSVARVGTELANILSLKNINVIHDVTYHDYPAYTGSYTRSLATINSVLNNNKDAQFVIDLHRDALGSSSEYGPCVKIGEEKVAQLMFVMGTDGGGLDHPNWNKNLTLAIKIQEKANEMYPGLFKPIILRNSRYNQHVTTGACIIEVGATGNTLEECNGSMKYLANVIGEVMK